MSEGKLTMAIISSKTHHSRPTVPRRGQGGRLSKERPVEELD
jgi:hypothetical protein